jgi:hypothetical protein
MSFDSGAPKGELQWTGRVNHARMAVFGPRITVRFSTVTRIPRVRCLLEPVRARREVHRDPNSPLIVHFRAQRSESTRTGPKIGLPDRRRDAGVSTLEIKRMPPCRVTQPHATSSSSFTKVGLCGLGRSTNHGDEQSQFPVRVRIRTSTVLREI